MRPKGIRKLKAGTYKPSLGHTGISVDILTTISTAKNEIIQTVEVTKPTAPLEAISESVGVVIT